MSEADKLNAITKLWDMLEQARNGNETDTADAAELVRRLIVASQSGVLNRVAMLERTVESMRQTGKEASNE